MIWEVVTQGQRVLDHQVLHRSRALHLQEFAGGVAGPGLRVHV